MSGHSKWSTIKRKKGAEDARRGKNFTRLAREIAVAAREGGADETSNPRLKLAVAKAKAGNMPRENIERAVLRGSGNLEGEDLVEVTYEGYGPDGVAYLIDTLTDNKNRTLADIKHALNKSGGSLASAGSVSWQFSRKGYVALDGNVDFEEIFLVAAEAGADDVLEEEGVVAIWTPYELLASVEHALAGAGYSVAESELRWEARNETDLPPEKAMQHLRLHERLEELDDVQSVFFNLQITDELASAFESG